MPTLKAIREQINAIPHRYIFFTGKEIRSLPEILSEGEDIKGLTSGMLEGDTWLAVCTNKRLLFVNRGMIYGLRQIQLPLDRIQSIDHQYGIVFGTIRVWDGASYFTISMVLRPSIQPFVSMVQEEMRRERKESRSMTISNLPSASPPASAQDLASQLERLAALMEKGVLTREEFETQKKKLLGNQE